MSTTTRQKITFIKIIIAIVFIWIIIAFWTKFVGNLCYVTLGLNQDCTLTTFCIAIIITLILICYVFSFDDDENDCGKKIQNSLTGLSLV